MFGQKEGFEKRIGHILFIAKRKQTLGSVDQQEKQLKLTSIPFWSSISFSLSGSFNSI